MASNSSSAARFGLALTTGALATVPLFVSPSSGRQSTQSLRVQQAQPQFSAQQASSAVSTQFAALAASGAATAVLAASSRKAGQRSATKVRAAREDDSAPPPPPFEPAKQVGALAPLGYFDPAGFSKAGDKEGFKNLRVAEIKHARVAMMAALGGVVQHYVKFPGFEKVPAGVGALNMAPGSYGFVALFLLSGALELGVWTQDPNQEAGNFGDPLGLGQYSEDMRNKELNNGRFAMFAALGIVAAELLTGKDAIQQLPL